MDGSDWIDAWGTGVKAIYDRGAGTDVVTVMWGYFEVKLTMINSDLYITSRYSTYSPVEDPNAVILMDRSFSDGHSIEYFRTAGGWIVDLPSMWSNQRAYASTSEDAAPGVAETDSSAQTFAPSGWVPGAIPEHLRHLVGEAATMISLDLASSGASFGLLNQFAFTTPDAPAYSAVHELYGSTVGAIHVSPLLDV